MDHRPVAVDAAPCVGEAGLEVLAGVGGDWRQRAARTLVILPVLGDGKNQKLMIPSHSSCFVFNLRRTFIWYLGGVVPYSDNLRCNKTGYSTCRLLSRSGRCKSHRIFGFFLAGVDEILHT